MNELRPGKVEVLAPTEFAKEVTREILRQNAAILKALLNPGGTRSRP